jgi:hypothetical protein
MDERPPRSENKKVEYHKRSEPSILFPYPVLQCCHRDSASRRPGTFGVFRCLDSRDSHREIPGTRDFFEKIIYFTFYLPKSIILKMDIVEMCLSNLFALDISFKIRITILLLIFIRSLF